MLRVEGRDVRNGDLPLDRGGDMQARASFGE